MWLDSERIRRYSGRISWQPAPQDLGHLDYDLFAFKRHLLFGVKVCGQAWTQ